MARSNRHHVPQWLALVVAAALVSAGVVAWWFASPPRVHGSLAHTGQSIAAAASTTALPPNPPRHPTTDRQRVLKRAHALLGVAYRYGAKGPDAYDCSGFTKAAYAAGGVTLPDGSFNQAAHDKPLVDSGQLVPGDLIFYRWAGNSNVSHVTMYAGDGWVIGTGTPGQPPKVALYPLASDLRYARAVLTYRHVRLPDER